MLTSSRASRRRGSTTSSRNLRRALGRAAGSLACGGMVFAYLSGIPLPLRGARGQGKHVLRRSQRAAETVLLCRPDSPPCRAAPSLAGVPSMADAAPTPSPLAHEVAVMRQRIADLEAALAAQQALVQALGARQDAAAQIVETVRDPLLLLDPHFRVQSANPAFYRTFQMTPAETEGQLLSQLDHGEWDMPAVRTLLEELLPQQTIVTDYEVTQSFARIGRRTLLLNARCLDAVQRILLAIEDITLRQHAETRLQQQQTRLARQMQAQMAALHHDMAERQRLAQEAQRVQHVALLSRLAAGVSHEM